MSDKKQIATTGDGPLGAVLRFLISSEVVKQNLDWSQPVQFRFEEREDGSVEMWLRTAS